MRKILCSGMIALLMFIFFASLPAYARDTPEQVFEKVSRALARKDVDEFIKHISERARKEILSYSPQERKEVLELLSYLFPRNIRITRRQIRSNEAILHAEGIGSCPITSKDLRVTGKIYFLKENNAWKQDREDWSYSSSS